MKKAAVSGKIKCIFEPVVVASASGKRKGQQFKVVASNSVTKQFIEATGSIRPTIKFDGTCCLVDEFNSRPWLWARHDIKPNKTADRRFKAYQHNKNEHLLNGSGDGYPEFIWDIKTDFKEIPENWKPASGVQIEDMAPDDIGHIVGWVPVDTSSRMHLWHLSVVDLNVGQGLRLTESDNDTLRVHVFNLKDFLGKTFELIGSNINANPYRIGSKKKPFHVLVQHGEFLVKEAPIVGNGVTHESLKEWFGKFGLMEGIVWHTSEGKMFKLHRCHLELPWPIDDITISSKAVALDVSEYDTESCYKNKLLTSLQEYNGKRLNKFSDIFIDETDSGG